jgi:NDP-sugar pyrophosphorylase family protein
MGELTADTAQADGGGRGQAGARTHRRRLARRGGIHDFFIIIGWCGKVIRDYFGDGARWGVRISYGEQKVQDGTGKAPELAKEWVGADRFLLMYGDILLRPPTDYALLVAAFKEDGVIAVKDGEDLTKGGAVVLDGERLHDRSRRKRHRLADSAECLLQRGHLSAHPRIFDLHGQAGKIAARRIRIHRRAQSRREGGRRLRGVTLRREWADVRDPSVLAELNKPPHAAVYGA